MVESELAPRPPRGLATCSVTCYSQGRPSPEVSFILDRAGVRGWAGLGLGPPGGGELIFRPQGSSPGEGRVSGRKSLALNFP